MANKRTVVDGNLDGTGGKKETMQQKLRDNISGGPALSTAKGVGRAANKLSEKAQEELQRIKEAQAKKNSIKTPVTNVDTETLKREDPVARMKRATGHNTALLYPAYTASRWYLRSSCFCSYG